MSTTTNENARREPGAETTEQTTNKPKRITKEARIIEALRQPGGLNRFQAEALGDHCLNSTVAVIRRTHGARLHQEWEVVPSRFNPDGVRVYRYRLL